MSVGFYPGPDAEGVDAYAKQVGWDETELAGMKADDTDNTTVNPGENETTPPLLADQNSGQNSKKAG